MTSCPSLNCDELKHADVEAFYILFLYLLYMLLKDVILVRLRGYFPSR